jgi:hypothetical protein
LYRQNRQRVSDAATINTYTIAHVEAEFAASQASRLSYSIRNIRLFALTLVQLILPSSISAPGLVKSTD